MFGLRKTKKQEKKLREWKEQRDYLERLKIIRNTVNTEENPFDAWFLDQAYDKAQLRERKLYAELSKSNEIIVQ